MLSRKRPRRSVLGPAWSDLCLAQVSVLARLHPEGGAEVLSERRQTQSRLIALPRHQAVDAEAAVAVRFHSRARIIGKVLAIQPDRHSRRDLAVLGEDAAGDRARR